MLPLLRTVAGEVNPPPLRTIVPVGAGYVDPPLTEIVIAKLCAVDMVDADGVTLTVGVTRDPEPAGLTVTVALWELLL